jgi:hypothetical protein
MNKVKSLVKIKWVLVGCIQIVPKKTSLTAKFNSQQFHYYSFTRRNKKNTETSPWQLSQVMSHFGLSSYVAFAMHLDIYTMYKYKAKLYI